MTAKKQDSKTVKNPDKQANLKRGNPATQFKSGVSGNPKGRPKKEHCLTSLVSELMAGNPETIGKQWVKRKDGLTGDMRIALKLVGALSKGDFSQLKEVWDRTEGKVPTPIVGKDDGPIRLSMSADELTDSELAEIIKTSKGK